MRILHVSDTHLGFSQFARLTPDGLNQREQDVFEAFRQAVDHAIREKPDVVVHSGDLFDSVRPTNRAVAFAMEQVARLAVEGIPFFVIAGNHETPRLRETGSVLRCLEFLPNVTACFRNRIEVARYGDLAVVGVPQADAQEAYDGFLDDAVPEDARYNLLVAHAGVVGVADFRTGEFNELTLDQSRLHQGWTYVALGHYHGATEVAPHAWYAGSTERTSFREWSEAKGCLLVDLAERTVRTLPVEARPMTLLPPIDAAELATIELGPRVVAALRGCGPEGKIVGLKVRRVPRSAYATLDFPAIRRAAESAVHLALTWEFEEETAVLQPGRGGATLGDEFDAFLEATPVAEDRESLRRLAKQILAEAEGAG